jgi:hypothetical protein
MAVTISASGTVANADIVGFYVNRENPDGMTGFVEYFVTVGDDKLKKRSKWHPVTLADLAGPTFVLAWAKHVVRTDEGVS